MTIGNKNTLAFELLDYTGGLLNLNFYLGTKLISNEPVYTPTYRVSLEKILEQLNSGTLQNERLNGLTSIELVKTLESERFRSKSQFFRHLLQIDETIDQYVIFLRTQDRLTQFSWYCWDKNNCNPEHVLNEIYGATVPTSQLISTLEQLIVELRKGAR